MRWRQGLACGDDRFAQRNRQDIGHRRCRCGLRPLGRARRRLCARSLGADGVGNHEVNAFQEAAKVVIQKSTREGFGLVVSEGLWKGRPVIGGNCGGIPLQVRDGETGYLVDNSAECGERLIELLGDEDTCRRMGAAGREVVREHFLLTRYLHDYVRMFRTLAGLRPSERD